MSLLFLEHFISKTCKLSHPYRKVEITFKLMIRSFVYIMYFQVTKF